MIKIKALVLAAGYATRLHPLTENQPKHLLEIADKPIIEHLLEKIKEVEEIEEVLIVTNARFHHQFQVWLNHYEFLKKIKLINDGTISNDDRLGAIGDLNYVLKEEEINDDLLVIAGDNLFGFSLPKFVQFFKEKNSSIVAFYDLKDKEKVKRKFGVGILEGSKIINFEEKPFEPKSTLAATACYVYKKDDLQHIGSLIKQGKGDAPGDMIKWLVEKSEVHGFVFDEYWFDVGSFESLKEAEEIYRQ